MPYTRIDSVARCPLLLVASDFDGTISPLAPSPAEARPDPRCLAALTRLAKLPCTHVAIISGRPLAWLKASMSLIPGVLLFGSHGAEDASVHAARGGAVDGGVLDRLAESLGAVVSGWPGTLIERKPFGVALHYRLADPAAAPAIVEAVRRIGAERTGIVQRPGSMVEELCLPTSGKGEAVIRARRLSGAVGTVFLGDDITDEEAFAALGPEDLAIKVGSGESRSATRVEDVEEVAVVLESLADRREAWLAQRAVVPIRSHSVLSDQRTLAAVTPEGRVVWLCLPRIDSAPLFGELVGGPSAGYFAIEPSDARTPVTQSYVPDSMLLQTAWRDFTVTDYLDCSGGRAFQRAGRSDLVRVVEGRGRVRIVFAPRLDFGRTGTGLRIVEHGVELVGCAEPCVLRAPGLVWTLVAQGQHHTAEAVADLDALGGAVTLELRAGTANLRPAMLPEPDRRAQTQRLWTGWAGALRPPAAYRTALVRSALTIKALCYGPSGAIAAAATTSLPEQLGGVRNWDYRFCWPRDAAMAAAALLRLGNIGHAMKFTEWLVGILDRLDSPEHLRPIYAVSGEDLGPEFELNDVAGYAGSRPVRIGNAAAHQVQLDVFGPIVHMVASMTEQGVPVSPDAWRLIEAMVHAVGARWEEPDHGIWEIRGPKQHHVHSKVMCWHAVDRALVVHDAVLGRDNPEWLALRDRIGAEVLERGWNEHAGAFCGCYGSQELDAASLAIGLCGLLPIGDPRWAATVDAVDRHLRDGPTVFRYRREDGLPGSEGGFVICACWLIESLVTLGRVDDARRLFDAVLSQAGPTGLFAEQWDPAHGEALGNFPQAYSHLGIIGAALSLAAVSGS